MAFGPNTPIQPTPVPSKNPISPIDDPFGDFTSSEVRGMNQNHKEEQRFWVAEHQ